MQYPCPFIVYKRMRRLLLLVVALVGVSTSAVARTYSVAELRNVQRADKGAFVANPDGILSAEAVQSINAICASLRDRGIAEVAVVAVESIEGGDPFSFGIELFEGWGVGDDKLDNGLGILLVEELREVRFFTGYGLEETLTDVTCRRLQERYMVPYFRDGDYSRGMVEGVRAVEQLLLGADLDLSETDEEDKWAWLSLAIVMALIVVPLGVILIDEYRKTKCPTCSKHKLRVVKTTIVERTATTVTVLQQLHCDACNTDHTRTIVRDNDQHRNNRGRGGGGMWVFPMGGFGGGSMGGGSFGGGFGGGSFGGGGAGSRW